MVIQTYINTKFFLFGLVLVGLGFDLRAAACKAGTLSLEPHLLSICSVILEMGLASNGNPPALSLPHS
jgi:hypothetical protein